jgi:hypothetical protein
MRALILIILLASTGWGGYWVVGSGAQQSAIQSWLDDRAGDGWVANYSEVSVQGFPNRFDSTVSDLQLADPKYGWSWTAPHFNIMQMSYQPNHFIAVWPKFQTISSPNGKTGITAEDMRASLVVQPDSRLALDRATITLSDVQLSGEGGWASSVGQAVLATRQSATEKFAHDIALTAQNVAPSVAFKSKIDPDGDLPTEFETLEVQTTAAFDRPWDLVAVEGEKPVWSRLDIDAFAAKWGDLDLRANGSVTLDRLGYPTGKLDVKAKNWQQILDLAVAAEAVPAELANTLASGLELLAMLSGDKDTLEIPLRFSNKIMSLGPVPIGDAPRLHWN